MCRANVIQKHLIGTINGCWPFEGLGITWLISSAATKASELLRPQVQQMLGCGYANSGGVSG